MRIIFIAAILSACATPGFKASDCERFRMNGYNILACDDVAVGVHCKRGSNLTDSGKPVTYHPRACHVQRGFGRKANIFIGKSFMKCLPHEICHEENPDSPAMCEKDYPCIGDRK